MAASQSIIKNIIGGSRKSNMAKLNSSYSLNMYQETQGEGSSAEKILRSILGNSIYLEMPEKICRGIQVCSFGQDRTPILFAVFGYSVYVIRKDGPTYCKIGNISTSCEYVSMCETGGQGSAHPHLVIVDGLNVYAVDTTLSNNDMLADWRSIKLPKNALDQIIKPSYCSYIKGFLVVNDLQTDGIYKSLQYPFETSKDASVTQTSTETETTLGEETTTTTVVTTVSVVDGEDQTDYDIFMTSKYDGYGWVTYSELSPDALTAMICTGSELWTFGPTSYQVWTWQDDINQPITPADTTAAMIGIKAPKSLSKLGPDIFWLGSSEKGNNGIYLGSNGSITKISNPDLEREIGSMTYSEDAIGQCWIENGHEFYAITFLTDKKTFVYDKLEQVWHNRSSRSLTKNMFESWEPQFAQLSYNKLIFGTLTDKYLIWLDPNNFEEYDGRPIIRLRESGATINDFSPVIIEQLQLIVNNGFIKDTVINPKIMLRVKRDGGSYSNVAQRRIGKIGQYDYQTNFDRLGVGRIWSFEISYSENTDFVIIAGKVLASAIGRF